MNPWFMVPNVSSQWAIHARYLNHSFKLEKLDMQLLKVTFEDVSQPIIFHNFYQQCKCLFLWKLCMKKNKKKGRQTLRTISWGWQKITIHWTFHESKEIWHVHDKFHICPIKLNSLCLECLTLQNNN